MHRAAIAIRAAEHLGHVEVGENRSPLIDAMVEACGFAANDVDGSGPSQKGFAWCAAFASWCLGLSPGCSGALRLGRKFKRTKTPQVGDLMFFATDDKGAGHIGIVVARIDDDLVLCIEGNSANSIRYVVRYAAEVKFASVSDEILPLPDVELDEAWPVVHVSKKGTR